MNLDPRDHLGDDRLRQIYSRQAGTVAFVDESYLQHPGGGGFYSLTATLVERRTPDALPVLRAQLLEALDVAKHGPWHTVKVHHWKGFARIHQALDFIAEQAAWHVVTVDLPTTRTSDANAARQRCLSTLLEAVCGGGNKATIVVMDTRDRTRDGAQDRQDLLTAHHLRSRRRIGPDVAVVHTDDRQEPLLWMADTSAWALQRGLVRGEEQWWEHVHGAATILHAGTGHKLSLEMQQRLGAYQCQAAQPSPTPPAEAEGIKLLQVQYLTGDRTRQGRRSRRLLTLTNVG